MGKTKIKLFSDSTCDLSKELISEMDIGIVSLYVTFDGIQLRDGLDIKEKELYAYVDKYKILPKTAAPSPVDFEEAFRPYVQQGYNILYIGLSSKMSASIQNGRLAAQEFPEAKIRVVDSMNLSTGIGLQVCAAYDYIEQGMEIDEVVEALKNITPSIKTAFTIETLDYLYKGGRCNAVQALISSMLSIMPIIKVVDGSMTVGAKIRGKKKKALDFMINEALPDKERLLHGRMFITFTSGSEEEANYMKEIIHQLIPDVRVYLTYAGCVIASHCGKKTIGLLYIAEE